MYSYYHDSSSPNETGIIFADKHSDFPDMTLQKVRELAGNETLPSNFRARMRVPDLFFGVIEL